MTKRQVAKGMAEAKITGELTGAGSRWEVELADEKTMRAFVRKVAPVGGYRTGYGAWILTPSYVSQGDYSNPSSRWHY